MTPIFNSYVHDGATLHIEDRSLENSLYVPESIENKLSLLNEYLNNRYKYSETCTINIIYKHYVDETTNKYLATLLTTHDTYLDEAHYDLTEDGYYSIFHVILPTKEWFESVYDLSALSDSIPTIYYFDTSSNTLYKYSNGTSTKIEDINTIACLNENETNISRCEQKVFSINILYKCYVKLCKALFDLNSCKCSDKTNLKDQIFNRDFVWMTINVIKYHIELGLFAEALRILEQATGCAGICSDVNTTNTKSSGCGCHS